MMNDLEKLFETLSYFANDDYSNLKWTFVEQKEPKDVVRTSCKTPNGTKIIAATIGGGYPVLYFTKRNGEIEKSLLFSFMENGQALSLTFDNRIIEHSEGEIKSVSGREKGDFEIDSEGIWGISFNEKKLLFSLSDNKLIGSFNIVEGFDFPIRDKVIDRSMLIPFIQINTSLGIMISLSEKLEKSGSQK